MNGYNFTERVRKVLAFAREEAVRLHHEYVGTEHLLLGLSREGEGVAATMLVNLNVSLEEIRQRIESIVKRGASPAGPDLPYTSRAKKVLELAMAEAREANHAYVGTEHLLLGLFREEKGIAAQLLADVGLTIENLRAEMHRLLGPTGDAGSRVGIPPGSTIGKSMKMRGYATPAALADDAGLGRIDRVIAEARKVAVSAGTARLEGLHIAIGLLAHGQGIAFAAMERIGCDLPRLEAELKAMMPTAASNASAELLPVGPDFARIIGAAKHEQQASREAVMATHHLLLALLETCPDVAQLFTAQGVTADRLRAEAGRITG